MGAVKMAPAAPVAQPEPVKPAPVVVKAKPKAKVAKYDKGRLEQVAANYAEYAADRSGCLDNALNIKLFIENGKGVGIQDWGNVRTAGVCGQPMPSFTELEPQVIKLLQAEYKKEKH
jgi:hypothetical protein